VDAFLGWISARCGYQILIPFLDLDVWVCFSPVSSLGRPA